MPKLFVGHIPPELTKDRIEKEFAVYGRVTDVWVARNPPGFAFVDFESHSDAENAIRETRSRSPDNRYRSGRSPLRRRNGASPLRHRRVSPTNFAGRHPYGKFSNVDQAPAYPFRTAAFPKMIFPAMAPYINNSSRLIRGSRLSPRRSPSFQQRRSRSPIGRVSRSGYDRYREDSREPRDSSYRRSRSRDRRRPGGPPSSLLSSAPSSQHFRRERSPSSGGHKRRGSNSIRSPIRHVPPQYPPFPIPPFDDGVEISGRVRSFQYDHRSPLNLRGGRRY